MLLRARRFSMVSPLRFINRRYQHKLKIILTKRSDTHTVKASLEVAILCEHKNSCLRLTSLRNSRKLSNTCYTLKGTAMAGNLILLSSTQGFVINIEQHDSL